MYVQAVRRISAGEEITLEYEDLTLLRAERLLDLQRKYKFKCIREHCINPSTESDDSRQIYGNCDFEAMGMNVLMSKARTRAVIKEFIQMLIKAVVILANEGLSRRYVLPYYVRLMKAYGRLGDAE